jgi:hypothetical protein
MNQFYAATVFFKNCCDWRLTQHTHRLPLLPLQVPSASQQERGGAGPREGRRDVQHRYAWGLCSDAVQWPAGAAPL